MPTTLGGAPPENAPVEGAGANLTTTLGEWRARSSLDRCWLCGDSAPSRPQGTFCGGCFSLHEAWGRADTIVAVWVDAAVPRDGARDVLVPHLNAMRRLPRDRAGGVLIGGTGGRVGESRPPLPPGVVALCRDADIGLARASGVASWLDRFFCAVDSPGVVAGVVLQTNVRTETSWSEVFGGEGVPYVSYTWEAPIRDGAVPRREVCR